MAALANDDDGAGRDELRKQGNVMFKTGKLQEAYDLYSAALDANANDAKAWANRAACLCRLALQNEEGMASRVGIRDDFYKRAEVCAGWKRPARRRVAHRLRNRPW